MNKNLKKRQQKYDEKFGRDSDRPYDVCSTNQESFGASAQDWSIQEIEELTEKVQAQKSKNYGRVNWEQIDIPNRTGFGCMTKW